MRYVVSLVLSAIVLVLSFTTGAIAHADEHGYEPYVAPSGVYKLETEVEYGQFDITGDGLPDALTVSTNEDATKMYVCINGTRVYAASTGLKDAGMYRVVGVRVAVLKNGKSFISLEPCGGWQTYGAGALLQYRAGVMKRVVAYNRLVPKGYGYWKGLPNLKVSGNKLVVSPLIATRTTGRSVFDFTYVYKNGTLKLSSKAVPIKKIYAENSTSPNKKFTAKKSMKAYKDKSCRAKKFTICKGQKVKFKKMYVTSSAVRFQVQVNGKTGWIKGSKRGEPPFKNLFMN